MILSSARKRPQQAFSLLEVMVAIAILMVGTFAILDLISTSLSNARRIQHPLVNASEVLSYYVGMTNKFDYGTASGSLSEIMGKQYADYNYAFSVVPAPSDPMGTNDIVELDAVVFTRGHSKDVLSTATTLMYDQGHAARSLGGGLMHQ
ncbi:MAG TPA: prepilin-type N-terminal cleavage/methylation domain-containing protein [Verrucomicrobiae bacterium]